jgi:hypothetical protein
MPHHATAPITLSTVDMASASDFVRLFSASIQPEGRAIHMWIEEPDAKATTVAVPAVAFELFVAMLDSMSKGKTVRLIEQDAEVTTGEMARLLNVSAPLLTRAAGRDRILDALLHMPESNLDRSARPTIRDAKPGAVATLPAEVGCHERPKTSH